MLIGYARVSTQDQNLELQCESLAKAGCKKVFEDKVSGTRAGRPSLAKTLKMLREGNTLVVWKLDRLGRSVKQLVDLVGELHKQDRGQAGHCTFWLFLYNKRYLYLSRCHYKSIWILI